MTVLSEFPVADIQGAYLFIFQPSRYSMEKEATVQSSVFTDTEAWLHGLAFNTKFHDMISTNGAIFNIDGEGPKSDEPEI